MAEDTLEQRIHLSQMLGFIKRPYLVRFRPKIVLSYFIADSFFYDLYVTTKDIKHLVSYWKGFKNPDADLYSHEILFEGILEAIDDEIDYIKKVNAFN